MFKPEQIRVVEAQLGVADALTGNWLPKKEPYGRLVHAERTAAQITHIGGIPGLLLDMDYVHSRQHTPRTPAAVRYNALHEARQEVVAARLAAGEVEATALIRDNAFYPILHASPGHVAPQARRLLNAMDEGWHIGIVPSAEVANALPLVAQDMILAGDPKAPDAVYQQRAFVAKPRELWDAGEAAAEQAGRIYTGLSQVAMGEDSTRVYLEAMASAK